MKSRGQDGTSLVAKIRSLKWVQEPSPITSLPELASELGIAGLYVKRDDLLPALCGGSKARKLDYLLATSPFDRAPGYHAVGGIGSGLLASLASACVTLKKTLHVHVFDEHADAYTLDNLAFTASVAQSVSFAPSRARLFLRHPALFRKPVVANLPVIPPGATSAASMVGMVRAGLELGEQISAGLVPEPERIYLPLASAGTAVGLAVGLSLARVPTKIHAVATIEHGPSRDKHIAALTRQILAWLTKEGISGTSHLKLVPIVLDRAYLGRAYLGGGSAAQAGACTASCLRLVRHGIALDQVYGGKTMAALLADAASIGKRPVLFWQTRRGAMGPVRGDWTWRLPEALRRRYAAV